MYYPNGDIYEGPWVNDLRVGRGKLVFKEGGIYHGNFVEDMADGNGGGRYEDKHKTFFRIHDKEDEMGQMKSGYFIDGRLRNYSEVVFENGDTFKGFYQDGRPNGIAEMLYKNSIISTNSSNFETAQYIG